MRRAVVAVIIGGYTFWGIGSGLGHRPVIVGARLTAELKPAKVAEPAEHAKAARPATQTVTFGGYTVSVPASWPVYDLTKNPRQCVRYDVHAVYLGTPGTDPDCPPNLVGRVDTVTIQAPAASAGTQTAGTKTAGSSKGPRQGAQQVLSPGTIVQDPDRHELALAMPDKAPSIGATYGTGPDATEQMLATVRQAPTKQASPRQAGPERAGDSIRRTGHPVVTRAAAHVTARNPAWPKAEAITGPGASWLTPPSTPPSGSKSTPKPTPKSTPKATPKPTGPVLASSPSPVPTRRRRAGPWPASTRARPRRCRP
jgi:hypothetical protein